MKSTPFVVNGKEYSLRFENKQQQDIKNNSPKKFEWKAKFTTPLEIINYLADTDVQTYLLMKGLEWAESGYEKINEEKAGQLRQDYLEEGEADAGEKYEAFQSLLVEALSLNVIGASGKKLIEKNKAVQETQRETKVEELARIYEAQALAKERMQARKNTSEPPSVS